jgi:hypothetical protein
VSGLAAIAAPTNPRRALRLVVRGVGIVFIVVVVIVIVTVTICILRLHPSRSACAFDSTSPLL